jgi:hypothetical protein
MSMSVAEARSEIKKRFEEAEVIENKYDDPEKMPNEERQQVKRLLGEIDGLEDKLIAIRLARSSSAARPTRS